ncbi:helicase C-terminal domain-containing protein [Cryobacterium sp. Hh11]|uniref:helicase C-terminal domain-containing protein n=1 Tax=Cryobacterium sp. Hh11 TaxID=2555868 RepID=UPI00141A6B42|nr:helicase C-terminal domain-containing protein [Cryobacterium sp. Hh11]
MSGIFSDLGSPSLASSVIDPKRLFRALTKPAGSKFKFPHDIQTEVWDKWFERRNEPDLVVKMNTGSGKTVIGLLIAKSSLNEGKGPAVYLVPDLQLKGQVGATADQLGIAWTDNPRDSIFRRGEAVLVVTVHTMYNGISKFGVRGVSNSPLDVGTIIIDDAHACIPIIEQQFSLRLSSTTPAYKSLFASFSDVLKEQSLSGWTDLVAGRGTQAVPVPYWAWKQNLQSSFAAINSVTDEEDEDHKFKWPLFRNQLELCDVAFTPREVEIRLPYPDLSVLPSFVNAKRRVFMTATLANDAELVTKMGVDEECVTKPITPASASDLGDRIILTPMETSRLVSQNDVKGSAVRWAKTHNVVVIVPSKPKSDVWKDVTKEIHDKKTIEDAVKRLQDGHVGLVVLIARYDGLDLPNEACRVLVLDGLPERYSPQELVEAVAIGGTEAMKVRQTQRIEQGMGRGVRSTDDYCAIILLDSRLVERLYTSADLDQLSPATRAQYDLSVQFSAGGRSKPMRFFDDAVEAFLSRDPGWTNASKTALEEVVYASSQEVDPLLKAERAAFEHAISGRYTEAFQSLASVYGDIADAHTRGWIKQRAASYLNHINPAKAREIQSSARIDNNYILKFGQHVAAPRITALTDQAAASSDFLVAKYPSGRLLEVAVGAMLLDLTPSTDKNSHKRFEAALELTGHMLGLSSSRPDQETGIGPDNLWAVGIGKYWVIEDKSEAVADEVAQDYLEQLSGSFDWFESVYGDAQFSGVPVLVHPSRQPMWDATPRQGARVMTFERLASFREAIKEFTTAIRVDNGFLDSKVVGINLTHFGLEASQLEQRWTQKFKAPSARP